MVEIKNIGQIYSLTIFGPIMEELIFRQGLYRDWLLKKLPKPVAFTLSVLIFTLLHLPQTSSQFIFYLIGSIAFNYLYDKTKCDIRPVILIHIVHNWLAIQ
jgi:membrane protease YdiL (CAAX protease family)